jgi:hypothetical protein
LRCGSAPELEWTGADKTLGLVDVRDETLHEELMSGLHDLFNLKDINCLRTIGKIKDFTCQFARNGS